MPDNESVAPAAPKKPFQVGRWLAALIMIVVALYFAINMIHVRSAKKDPETQASLPSSPNLGDMFDRARQTKLAQLERDRARLAAELKEAGLDPQDFAAILDRIPECNEAQRLSLSGKSYASVIQRTGQVVQFVCSADNQWHPLPLAASGIIPPTRPQEKAMRVGAANTSGKDKAASALEAALKSNGAIEYATPSKTVAAEPDNTPAPVRTVSDRPEESKANAYPWDSATGKEYKVFEGGVIEAILTNRLAGEFTGPVNVMVSTNYYSGDNQHVLIPKGARILGTSSRVDTNGQRRLAITFHRIIMQDGYSKDFPKFPGLDQQGATGLTGRVDTHWLSVLTTAVMVGAIEGLSEYGSFGASAGGLEALRYGIGEQTGQVGMQILQRSTNRLPNVTVYEGTRVRIWIQHDFDLPDWENHTVAPNL